MTLVTNLITNDVYGYCLPPQEAVMCAFGAGQNNSNTWTYDKLYSHLIEYGASGKTVSCGDYIAVLEEIE